MNAERLLAHYEKIADAPDAIAQLRRFILDLAVRGKLVPQDPKDEPASELLKRIAKEKARLVKARELRKPRDLDTGNGVEEPFAIPATWRWLRLDGVGAIVGGGTPAANDADNFAEPGAGVPWLTPADLGGYKDLYISRGSRDLSEKGAQASSATLMPKGTVLFTSRAPIGYVAIAANPISTNQGFKSVVPYVSDCSRFIATAMRAFAPEIDAKAPGTTFKEVSGKIVSAVPFPLPPLAEQHRIVAKVDELMGLCDRLEASRASREAVRDRLAAASLARLNAPDSTVRPGKVDAGFTSGRTGKNESSPAKAGAGFASGDASEESTFHAYARFALDALPALTTRPDQIKALRQTILNLAVRGKLVPQDSTDEAVKVEKRHKDIGEAEVPFEAPRGWRWLEFGDVAKFENGDRGKNYPNRDEYVEKGVAWINTGHIQPDGSLSLATMNFITRAKFDMLAGGKIKPGDLLYCLRGATFGKTAFVEPFVEGAIASSLMIIRPGSLLDRRFTYLYLISPLGRSQLLRFDNGTAQPNLSSGNVKKYFISVPPLAEQHRIVAKVDALMALCDRLETSLTAAAAIRRRLLDALLAEALAPAAARELEAVE